MGENDPWYSQQLLQDMATTDKINNLSNVPGVSISDNIQEPTLNTDINIDYEVGQDIEGLTTKRINQDFLDIYLNNKSKGILQTNNILDFSIPSYGVQDFINERALWQKGIHNLTGEPGWFYFKIFFNFQDSKGLFGGILNNEIPLTSALRYLYGIRKFYKYSKIEDRILSLARFTFTLSYINSISPWFFIGLNGVNKLNSIDFNELTKEKSIDIICNGESVDMRLNTLLDMYKYACYDEINQKEIIPQNLRKFDMNILVMNIPIKYFQTAMIVSGQDATMNQIGSNGSTLLNKTIKGINSVTSFINGSMGNRYDYKTTIGDNNSIDNKLSFQMYELKNCEIDPISFEGYVPSGMNNSQFFRQGTGSIKINYDRVYKVTYNEWSQMMYGSTGIIYDKYADEFQNMNNLLKNALSNNYKIDSQIDTEINNKRVNDIRKSIYNTFFNKDTEAYKGLIDFSEAVIQDSLINVNDPKYLGNINDNMDINNYEDLWRQTKNKINNFFKF